MGWILARRRRLIGDRRGFTRLEFSLLTAMLCAMIVNGIATLGGGLGIASKPMGTAVTTEEVRTIAELPPAVPKTMQH